MGFRIEGQKLDTWQVAKAFVAEDRFNGEKLSPFATIKMYRKLKAIVPKGVVWDLKNLDNLKKAKTESSVLSVEKQESQNQEVLNNLKTSVRTEEDDLYLRAIEMNKRGVFVPQGKKGKMLFVESKLVASLKADKPEENREKSKLLGAIDHCKKNCEEHKQTIEGCNTELQRISERLSNLQEKCKKAGIDTSQVTVGRYKLCDLQEKLKELQENAEQILGQCNKVIGESESIMNGGSSILRLISDPSRKEKIPPKEVMPDQKFEYVDDNSAALTEISNRNAAIIQSSHPIEQESAKFGNGLRLLVSAITQLEDVEEKGSAQLINDLFLLDEAVEQVENTSEEQLKNVQIQRQRMKAKEDLSSRLWTSGELLKSFEKVKSDIGMIDLGDSLSEDLKNEKAELEKLYAPIAEAIQQQSDEIATRRDKIDHPDPNEQNDLDLLWKDLMSIDQNIGDLQDRVDQLKLKGMLYRIHIHREKLQACEQQFVTLKNDLQDTGKVDDLQCATLVRQANRGWQDVELPLSKLREAENTVSMTLEDTTNRGDRHIFAQACNNETSNTIDDSFQTYQTMNQKLDELKSKIEIFKAGAQQETSVSKGVGVEVPKSVEVAKPHSPDENHGSALPDQPFSWQSL